MSTTASFSASSFSSSASSLSSVAAAMNVVETWESKRSSAATATSVPELLRMRQTHGVASPGHNLLIGATTTGRKYVSVPYLGSRGAWNTRRLQNTILVVGPGTPASVVTAAARKKESTRPFQLATRTRHRTSSSSSSSNSTPAASDRAVEQSIDEAEEPQEQGVSMGDDDENEDDNDDEESSRDSGRRRRRYMHRAGSGDDADGEGAAMEEIYEFLASRGQVASLEDGDDDEEEDSDEDSAEAQLFNGFMGRRRESPAPVNRAPHYCPSMRHGGCINTAAWLDTGWRLSSVSDFGDGSPVHVHGVESGECPTQLVTSGDDHLLKFWDVSEAMGSVSPFSGGSATICPFSASKSRISRELEEEWQSVYEQRQGSRAKHSNEMNEYNLPGSVRLMSTIHTGHRGNVFHVTPVAGKAGIVATCGADGFLRLTDVQTEESRIVVSPDYEDEISGMLPVGLLSLRSAMCYSHHFMNRNVGLLCSERGLKRFDLRLPPREQSTQRLLSGAPFRTCKACAILSAPSASSTLAGHDEESSYVFVGGSSRMVALCDLRMTDDAQNRVVQTYCPSGLSSADHVSVSGLDLSRDRRELLVSYESDQIYTFPIFPNSDSRGRSLISQVEELETSAESSPNEIRGRVIKPFNELATYGAHLNRFTFLKNARYAGPRDEYICTGSDSGHAWVYEKATGAVSSFWLADNSTCNGVIPHPILPVFATYGIDSTAKLWRASLPVDAGIDDSAVGRRQHSRTRPYEMSPTVRSWDQVKSILDNLDLHDDGIFQTKIFPDHIPSTKISMRRGRLARSWLRDTSSSRGTPRIGNDLHNLEFTLKDNLYTCLRSLYDDDVPVKSDINDLKHRVSLIRLRYQADRLGLTWNLSAPWSMESKEVAVSEKEKLKDTPEDYRVDCSDLVPDYPSDWMPYHPEMGSDPFDFCNIFNISQYEDFYREQYAFLNERNAPKMGKSMDCRHRLEDNPKKSADMMERDTKDDAIYGNGPFHVNVSTDEDDVAKDSPAKEILLETMKTLKDGGNAALKAGNLNVAAYRYDKAIQYAAMLYMKYPDADEGKWTPLRKMLVTTRLNLALLLLKPYFSESQIAEKQAKAALQDLSPFCDCCDCDTTREGSIRDELLSLQGKAYFRLGSAHFEMRDYCSAIDSFNASIKSTRHKSAQNSMPDQLVLRRLAEAKREKAKQSKRQRKKFKFAFASTASRASSIASSSSSVEAAQSARNKNAAIPSGTRSDTASTTSTAIVSNKKAPPPASGTDEIARN